MSVTTLCGSNSYEIGQELRTRLERFLSVNKDSAGIERIDATSVENDGAEIIARLESPTLFASQKLVIIRDLSQNPELSEQFIDWLESLGSDQESEIVIVDPGLDGRSKLYKQLKAKTDFKEYGMLNEAMLRAWVQKAVRSAGGTIGMAEATYLIDYVGLNQQSLASEIEKLLIYDSMISKASIELLVEPNIESTTFQLADAAFARQRAKAIRLYLEQRANKTDAIMVIGALAWQLHLLMLVKSAEQGSSADQIAKETGLNPWAVSKAKQLAQAISAQDLASAIDKLLLIDIKSKSARNYNIDDALQHYLLSV